MTELQTRWPLNMFMLNDEEYNQFSLVKCTFWYRRWTLKTACRIFGSKALPCAAMIKGIANEFLRSLGGIITPLNLNPGIIMKFSNKRFD